MKKIKDSKIFTIILVVLMYVIAFIGSFFVYKVLVMDNILLKFFIADIIGTLIIFIFSIVFNNSSIYDPYWSLAPMVMAPLFLLEVEKMDAFIDAINIYSLILIGIIELWGVRLTINCLSRWKNLNHQDWRYNKYQEKHPKIWPLISLTGIHLMPTIVVFIAMLPVFSYFNAFNTRLEINGTWILCIIVSLIAIIVETIADKQLDNFKKDPSNQGKICRKGLWKNSRHPNYFGEILFWFSMFLFALSVQNVMWILVFSPMIVFLLFVVITIPMMEKRQMANKIGYAEYKKETNMLLPIWPPEK